MSYQSNSKIITNRQLNFTVGPVDTYNKKEMPHRLENYEIDGTWNHHQSIILDVILDMYFRSIYKNCKRLPQSWRSIHVINKVSSHLGFINPGNIEFISMPPRQAYIDYRGDDVIGSLRKEYQYDRGVYKKQLKGVSFEQYVDRSFKNNHEFQEFKKSREQKTSAFIQDALFTFDLLKMFEIYNVFINKYKYSIIKHFEKFAQTKFRMTYKVKYMEQQPTYDSDGKRTGIGKLVDMHYKMREFQHLFEMSVTGTNVVLNFNTPLGKLVLYNMLILDTDWCPVEAVSLSKNAYFIYKRFVMSKRNGKFKAKRIELKFEEVKKFLDIDWKNDSAVHNMITKALDDMVLKGLLQSFECEKYRVGQKRYKLHFEK